MPIPIANRAYQRYCIEMVSEALRIRVIRAIMGISRTDMAKMIDVNPITVRHWECGHYEPQRKLRARIADLCREQNIAIRPDGFPVPSE